MRIDLSKKLPLLLIIFFHLSHHCSGQSKEEVIERYFQTLGGRDNWEPIRTKFSFGDAMDFENGSQFKVYFFYKKPNLQKFVKIQDSDTTMTCFDGHTFFRLKNGVIQYSDPTYSDYIGSTTFLGYADVLKDASTKIEYLGRKDLLKQNFEVLLVKRPSWPQPSEVYFHPVFGLLMAIKSVSHPSFTLFSDYRMINGALIHHEEISYQKDGGALRFKITYTSVDLNVPMDEDFFSSTKVFTNEKKIEKFESRIV